MVFSSSIFIFLFFSCVIFIYYLPLRKSRRLQNLFLTLASLCFYAWGEPVFVLVMVASILANWGFALAVHSQKGREGSCTPILVAMLTVNLGILFVFKYLMFTLNNLNFWLGLEIAVPTILLPIGLSFFTFQAISYVVDVYRGRGEVQKNPFNVALYIAFFPQLIAGPIVRYETIAHQIHHRQETVDDFAEGCRRFIIGLGKKMILANHMAVIADAAFQADSLSLAMAWLGAIAYSLQIYYDFSGYSDMAIGLGRIFGFHFLENFNYPYVSKSISEFWRRWHISLGSWFRDYVYFPLGGSRVSSNRRMVANLFVVWLLTGIWHGANWTFIVWGLMYFALIALEKMTGFEGRLGWAGHLYTMVFVVIGWVIFRADSLTQAMAYLGAMAGQGTSGILCDTAAQLVRSNRLYLALALLFSLPVGRWVEEKRDNPLGLVVYPIAILLTFLVSVALIAKGGYNPFIYFNF